MEVALRRSLRGLAAIQSNADCYANSGCRAATDTACYTTGAFTDFCKAWRAYSPSAVDQINVPGPVPVSPPPVVTTPGAGYGQATVDGSIVSTPEQAQILINEQIAAADAATKAGLLTAVGQQASANCQMLAADCGPFTSINPECTECVFDPSKPLFLLLVFGAVALLIGKPWK
jgi:hypothetical protein